MTYYRHVIVLEARREPMGSSTGQERSEDT